MTRVETVAIVARHELRTAFRGRLVPALGALFALLAAGLALAGLAASGELIVQGFTRTAVSLATLALYVLPLVGAVMGASAFAGDEGAVELLLAQPISRAEALLGRVAGLAIALATVAIAGFGAAALLVGIGAGLDGIAGYALVALASTLVGVTGLGVGILVGVIARRRTTAIGWALALWLAAAVLYDLAAIAVLQLAGDGQPGRWLIALLALNPIDGVRALALVGLGADVLLGPTGAALQRLLGDGGGAALVLASLAAWLTLPLGAALRTYQRRDF